MEIFAKIEPVKNIIGSINMVPSGGASAPVIQRKDINTNGTYTAPQGVDGYSPVVVDVPTGPARSASDLTASGATVTVPAGLYSTQAQKSVRSGSEGTPTATKSISGHTATVTPRVNNGEGYISGGSKTGNPVTVTASELASGTKNVTQNGTTGVIGYSYVNVNVPSQDPVIQSKTITENGTYTPPTGVDGFAPVVVNVQGGGMPTRTNKYRPPDWPDYDSLTLPNKGMAFFTIDTQLCDPKDLIFPVLWYFYDTQGVGNYPVQIDRGYIENGQFIVTESYENLYFAVQNIDMLTDFDRNIPTDEGRFVSYRIYNSKNNAVENCRVWLAGSFVDANGNIVSATLCPVVEVYLWNAGNTGAPQRGYETCTNYTVMYTQKKCLSADGTNLFWSNTNRIPKYIELDELTNTEFSFYYPFNGGSNVEHIILKNFTMNNTNATGSAFNGCSRLTGIDFENMSVKTIALNACFASCSSLQSLDLSGWDVSAVANASTCFDSCSSLLDLDISGWDLSNATNITNMFRNTNKLKNVVCDGTVFPALAINFAQSGNLTDASLVNIANALPTANQTITLHATPKGKLAAIMGTVSAGVFTVSDGGTVSLQNFITQTKGWTIA